MEEKEENIEIINLPTDELINRYNKIHDFLTSLDQEIKSLEEELNEKD